MAKAGIKVVSMDPLSTGMSIGTSSQESSCLNRCRMDSNLMIALFGLFIIKFFSPIKKP